MSAIPPPLLLRLHRPLVATALFFFFALAFVAAPFWLLAESRSGRISSLLATVAAGALWTWISARALRLSLDRRAWIPAVILLPLMAGLNLRALTSAIPWRGDEGYHIAFVLSFAKLIPTSWLLLAILASGLLLFAVWRRPGLAAAACAVLVAGGIGIYLLRRPPPLEAILRYPFVSRWFQALTPILLRPLAGLNHEVLYRIVPFVSAAALCWLYARSVHPRSPVIAVVLGLAAATVPSLFYYSSMLYLEMPAVLLMYVVCRDSEELLALPFAELTARPAWYALVLIGFIKETTAAFLLAFVALRIIIRARTSPGNAPWWKLALEELLAAAGVLLPLVVYLAYRSAFGNPREFHFLPANLLDPRLAPVLLRSFLEQFGLLFLLFLAGLGLLAGRRQFRKALFLLAAVIATTLFHLLDAAKYAGYSRFNLFVLPAVLAGSVVFLQFVGTKKKWYLPALAALLLASNLALSPVNWDGSKKPYWGNYLDRMPAEHYYPYRQALAWLKEHGPPAAIQFAGMGSAYYFDFYFDQLDWHPPHELLKDSPAGDPATLRALLQRASQKGVDCVVVRGEGDIAELQQAGAAEQWRVQLFRNRAHSLLVFTKQLR